VDLLCGFAAVVGCACVLEGEEEGRRLMFAVVGLLSVVVIVGFGLGASAGAGS